MTAGSDAGTAAPASGPLHRRPLVRYVASHAFGLIAEWGALIGLLVYAFEHSGPSAVGIASFMSLVPYVLMAPTTSRLAQRHPAAVVRCVAMVLQGAGFAAAGVVAIADGPLWLVVLCTGAGFTAATAMRPAGAVLLPALVRTSRELTTANVWVGYADSSALMLGPLSATVLLGIHGPGVALVGCAILSCTGAAIASLAIPAGPPATAEGAAAPVRGVRSWTKRVVTGPFADVLRVTRHRGSRAVLGIALAEFMLVGASDVIWVVVAGEHIDLGDAGAGVLSALFGAGSFLSMLVSGRAARRPRLAPVMFAALAAIATSCFVLGAAITLVAALVLIPVLGLSRALLDLLSRLLLQRSAPPSELASVFGAMETAAGLGLLTGSLIAQVLIAWSGAAAALVGVGAVFACMLAALARSLRAADDAADVPVVQMTLLRQLSVFAPLPSFELEAVSRSAREVTVADGDVVIRAGDEGDCFYAVADGSFVIVRDGRPVDTVTRGQGFGEIALLADVPRTATVTANGAGSLLAIDRDAFLLAVTGHAPSHEAAWTVIREWGLDHHRPGQ